MISSHAWKWRLQQWISHNIIDGWRAHITILHISAVNEIEYWDPHRATEAPTILKVIMYYQCVCQNRQGVPEKRIKLIWVENRNSVDFGTPCMAAVAAFDSHEKRILVLKSGPHHSHRDTLHFLALIHAL